MPPVKAICFDLDNTLVWYDEAAADRARAIVYKMLAEAYGTDPALIHASYLAAGLKRWTIAENAVVRTATGDVSGHAITREIWQEALMACGCSDPDAPQLALDLYWQNRAGVINAYDDVLEVLQALQGRYPLAVITNGPADTQLDKLAVHGLDTYFDAFIASGEAGHAKPDRRIFDHALARLNATPETTLHVGDNLIADIAGAHNAGLRSVWLNRNGTTREAHHPEPHHEIPSLRELMTLLN